MVKLNNSIKLKSYKDLIAWQKAYNPCLQVYSVSETFPGAELFGLTSQLRRCAVSVPSNIAEGYSRSSTKDYLRFLHVSYSSLSELETQLLLSKDLNYIKNDQFQKINQEQNELQRVIYGLIKSLRTKAELFPKS